MSFSYCHETFFYKTLLLFSANSHWPRSPQKSTLFSSSSGFSSSFQSNSSFSPGNGSSTQSAPLQQSSESFGSSKSGPPPPPPPKRKYRSIGAGSEIPVDEIVCFRRGDDPPDNLTSQHKASVNFGSIVKQTDIDAAYNIFPPAPKQYSDASVSTNSPKMASCALQTENIESGESWTQTKQTLHKDAKCDPIPNLIQVSCVSNCAHDSKKRVLPLNLVFYFFNFCARYCRNTLYNNFLFLMMLLVLEMRAIFYQNGVELDRSYLSFLALTLLND